VSACRSLLLSSALLVLLCTACAVHSQSVSSGEPESFATRVRDVDSRLWHSTDEFTGARSVFPTVRPGRPLGYARGVAVTPEREPCAFFADIPYAYAEFLPWVLLDSSNNAQLLISASMRWASSWVFLDRVYVKIGDIRHSIPEEACHEISRDVDRNSVFALNRPGVDIREVIGVDYEARGVKSVVSAIAEAPLGTEIRIRLQGREGGVDFTLPPSHHRAWKDMLFYFENLNRWWAGDIVNGYLGVNYSSDSTTTGVTVTKVLDGTPAQSAGLRKDDVIVELNGHSIKDRETFRAIMKDLPPGTKAELVVLREGARTPVTAVLGSYDGSR